MTDNSKRPNTRGKFVVEFTAADVINMADLCRLGSATALMYGKEGEQSRDRFRELAKQFVAMSPLPKSNRSEGYKWFDACQKLKEASLYEAYAIETEYSYAKDKRHIVLDVDGKKHLVCEDIPLLEATECMHALNEFLDEVAGMNAVRYAHVTVVAPLGENREAWWSKSKMDVLKLSSAFVKEHVGDTDLLFSVTDSHIRWKSKEVGYNLELQLSVHPSDVAQWEAFFAPAEEETETVAGPAL